MADAAVDSAPNDENDDSWLYGESHTDQTDQGESGVNEKNQPNRNVEGDHEV